MRESSSNEKSKIQTRRISRSKSGFSGSSFVLVFKSLEGDYSQPQKIPRDDAIEIARDFSANADLAKEYNVSASVAQFIRGIAIRRGLLTSASSDSDLSLADLDPNSVEFLHSDEKSTEEPAATRRGPDRKPKYFPEIDAYLPPVLKVETTEVIAFILSGVDPALREKAASDSAHSTLRYYLHTATSRVSPGLMMQEDHWYILFHLHHMNRDEFKLAWEEGQSQATGQANTDVVKLMSQLDKFRIDASASSLSDVANKKFFLSVQEKSIELLSRIFRRIRRKIETANEQPISEPAPKNWLSALVSRKPKEPVAQSFVQPEVIELVNEYLNQGIKLGRILRSDILKPHR